MDDVRAGRAVAPAMVWWVVSLGLFFGTTLVAGALDPAIAGGVLLIGLLAAAAALAVGLVIAVRWVLDLWASE